MKIPFFFILAAVISALLVAACGGHTPQESAGVGMDAIPQTPEAIVRRYQAYIDSNLFALAQRLSTPRSASLHEMMAAIVADTPADSSLIHTQFLDLNCAEAAADTIICTCLLKDEYEEYTSEYILVNMDGRWLVDLPEEGEDFELFEQETMEEWPKK